MDKGKKRKMEGEMTYLELLPGPALNTILTMNLLDKMEAIRSEIKLMNSRMDGISDSISELKEGNLPVPRPSSLYPKASYPKRIWGLNPDGSVNRNLM